jgi:hypothetical protein
MVRRERYHVLYALEGEVLCCGLWCQYNYVKESEATASSYPLWGKCEDRSHQFEE